MSKKFSVLFSGDSITRGNTGAAYVSLFTKNIPGLRIRNIAENGDTLTKIAQNTIDELRRESRYDFVVLQSGYNDILLPLFEKRNRFFRFAFKEQIRNGQRALKGKHFEEQLQDTIDVLRELSGTEIILVTVGCIGERTDSAYRAALDEINQCIRNIGRLNRVSVADCASSFDEILINGDSGGYMLNSFWNVTIFDRVICRFPGGTEWLSRKRKLKLTTDGVHLNRQGAEIFYRSIRQAMTARLLSKSEKINSKFE